MTAPTKIGVTGVAGFIGSHLTERLLAEGREVVGIDDFSHGSPSNLATFAKAPGFRFVELDCRDALRVRRHVRGLRRDRPPGRREDPALRQRAEDAAGQRRRRRVGLRGRAGARRAGHDRVDLGRLRQRDAALRGGRRARRSGRPRRGAGPTRRRSSTTSTSRWRWRRAGAAAQDPALLRLLRPAQPPELVGRPAGGVLRGPARRRAHGHPRRRPAGPDVHVRRRHGRRRRPRARRARGARARS